MVAPYASEPSRSQPNEWAPRSSYQLPTPLERLNGEIKRRSEVVGTSFPTRAAVTRLIGALLLEQNDEWAVQRARYMSLETISSAERCSTSSLCRLLAA